MKQKFMNDLQIIYEELTFRQSTLNNYFELLERPHLKSEQLVKEFLNILELKYNSENTLASLNRIINLREDSLNEVLKKSGFKDEEIIKKQEEAYLFVSHFHIGEFEKFIIWMKDNKLLNDFYWTIIEGIHAIGISMSGWQSAWTSHIIYGINRDLYQLFNGDEEKIFKKLTDENLLDLDYNNSIGDRCYSVLHRNHDGSYSSISYAEAFKEEVSTIVETIDILVDSLETQEDRVFNQKKEWQEYFIALKEAFGHTDTNKLIKYWAKVDEKWMAITGPIQLGHPLEYYEDHYRKAVALEWDLRIINPNIQKTIKIDHNIEKFILRFSQDITHANTSRIIDYNIQQINKTQLYIGRPLFYYGAEFNGLFSAQVVPNDENVSAKFGKKIFAYPDFILQSKKSKPIMQISVEFLGIDFIRKQKEFIEKSPQIWYKIYDILTIGHEFGHILWMDKDTEKSMNKSGQFKNIEEFKATASGLMAFFNNEKNSLKNHIIDDLVSRAIGLMAWREVGEVLPYYCEGLIHLDILFSSSVISYDGGIKIHYEHYNGMKRVYQNSYKYLAQNYIDRLDADVYLSKYIKRVNGIYLPKRDTVLKFVEKYYSRYKEIGQQVYQL